MEQTISGNVLRTARNSYPWRATRVPGYPVPLPQFCWGGFDGIAKIHPFGCDLFLSSFLFAVPDYDFMAEL
eukprot:3370812-Rhodomonas_salina.1